MEDVTFSEEQHEVWAELYRRQLPNVQRWACSDYLDGFQRLDMTSDRIPTLDELNAKITPATGWTVVRTSVRYTDADDWYRQFDKKNFLITDYMRGWDEIDWTPEPDMFHDIFGHLPFMTLPHYARLQEKFAPAYLRATTDEQKENIKRLAWFSTEFGLIREDGDLKVFGTGLMSGADEMARAMSGERPTHPFTIENVIKRDKAVDHQNEELFVIDSIERLSGELDRYFDTF